MEDPQTPPPATEEKNGTPVEDQEEEEKVPKFDWMPEGMSPLADGEYDAIVMGTGLKECIMSGLLSVLGMKILHVDRNNYYGGECASLNLTNLFKKFREGQDAPAGLGSDRDYNIDLIPKFIMACGNLVKMLLHTKVTRYLEFKNIDGSYVFKKGKILKVPATPEEALRSSLMGMFEKRRFRTFLIYLSKYEEGKPETHEGRDLNALTMRQLYEAFGLDENTQSFVGHAMGLQRDDAYLDLPALPTVKSIQLYCYSLERYGKSPYIYPVYGLGGLPEGFSRLCAINGGTFMLNCPVEEVLVKDGAAWGIRAGNEIAKATMVIGDPSYFPPEKVRTVGRTVRSICILEQPLPSTSNAPSTQIIIPARQVGRTKDIYVCMVSNSHYVCARDKYVAIASTTVETDNPIEELAPAFGLMPPIIERFDTVSDLYEPVEDGTTDRCFISSSYDATSHFETATDDVLKMYERVTGSPLDLTINADTTQGDY